MSKRVLSMTVFAVVLAGLPLMAQKPRLSPHETISMKIDSNRITVTYGRPYTKDPKTGGARKIWGGLVPFDKIWRTGADEATLFITQKPVELGGVAVPAGAYTLFTLPAADGSAKLLVNRQIGQWGVDPYDPTQELARIPLLRETTGNNVEQFTMMLERNTNAGGWLRMAWESNRYSVPIALKK